MEKLNRKIIVSIVCSIIIFISFMMCTSSVHAENKTGNESSTETTVKEKSSNANLKDFGIKPHDFSGFKPDNTSYKVTVPADTKSVEIYAVLQDENAKITGTGIKDLKSGDNNFDVTVIAEDGTKKTYKINIIRDGEGKGQQEDKQDEKIVEEQNTETVQEQYSGDGLASLKIENLELSPSFDTVIYEYTAKYIGDNTSLDIKTTTTDPYYTVEITGNEELKEGENIINVLVSDPDGKNVATYQITVNKSLVDEEAIAREQEEIRKKEQQKGIIIGGSIGFVILVIIIVLIIRHRRDKAWTEEYSVPFSGLNNEEELPKLLRDDEVDFNTKSTNDLDENEEELTKEQAREKFLNSYNNDSSYNDYKEIDVTPIRKKHKGKRFK